MPTKNAKEELPSAELKLQRQIRRKTKKIRTLYIVLAILVIGFAGALVAGYMQYDDLKNENARLSNPQESAKAETERLKSDIAKLVDVPTDEEPTIATVSDISKLKDQPFFANAENGDKVFMYAKAKKAILYRPSTNKVIELAPINSTENTPDKQDGVKASSTQTPSSTMQTPATDPTSSQTPTNP